MGKRYYNVYDYLFSQVYTKYPVVVEDTETGATLKIALPGVKKTDVKIEGKSNKLVFDIQVGSEYVKTGKFELELGDGISAENATASFNDGILYVKLKSSED